MTRSPCRSVLARARALANGRSEKQKTRPRENLFPHRVSSIDVDARVTLLHPPDDSEAGATEQRDPVRPAFSQSVAPLLEAAGLLQRPLPPSNIQRPPLRTLAPAETRASGCRGPHDRFHSRAPLSRTSESRPAAVPVRRECSLGTRRQGVEGQLRHAGAYLKGLSTFAREWLGRAGHPIHPVAGQHDGVGGPEVGDGRRSRTAGSSGFTGGEPEP
jgi:hypothetical protein